MISTLEKAINLLQEMPEQTVEAVYAFMQSMLAQQDHLAESSTAFGIAHKYANPALIEHEKGRLSVLWSKNMKLVDANVILRYLLNDNPEMAQKAKTVIESGAYTKPEIIAEVVYVLKGVYHATRADIRVFIRKMLNSIRCSERDAVVYAVDVFADTSLDFVDCL